MSIDAVVLGSAGYVGGELLRLMHAHPAFRLAAAVSNSHAGQPLGTVFPHLGQVYAGTRFTAPGDWAATIESGRNVAIFSAAPHGTSAVAIAAALETAKSHDFNVHVVDSSADFRYSDPAMFAEVYGMQHPKPQLVGEFTCAVPEHLLGGASMHAAHPGCFATASLLAAVPLVRSGLVDQHLFVHGITGSTGSGTTVKPGTHHPERHSNLYAYQALQHRHAPEMEALLTAACGGKTRVHFVPHSGPFARGIHVTLQARLKSATPIEEIAASFRDSYAASPFVHYIDSAPRLKDVVASNQSYISAAVDAETVSVMCVIDNLVKGAAGGAIQWMNRLWQLPEDAGLLAPAPAWT